MMYQTGPKGRYNLAHFKDKLTLEERFPTIMVYIVHIKQGSKCMCVSYDRC